MVILGCLFFLVNGVVELMFFMGGVYNLVYVFKY